MIFVHLQGKLPVKIMEISHKLRGIFKTSFAISKMGWFLAVIICSHFRYVGKILRFAMYNQKLIILVKAIFTHSFCRYQSSHVHV